MAKKSKRRHLQYEKDQSGCMWGLINIFDFRRAGSAQNLITDRRRGIRNVAGAGFSGGKLKTLTDSDKGQAIDDHNGVTGGTYIKPSVKKLIEEEMFGEVEGKTSQSEPESSAVKKARTRTVRTCSKSDDINAIVDELYIQIQQKNAHQSEHLQSSSRENHLDFHEKLSEATMVFITQKFISKGNIEGDEKIHHSEEFLNALETLVSNKNLLLELLEDPNSVLVKHIQTLQETMAEKDGKSKLNGEFTNGKQYSYFRGKVKSRAAEIADSTNRIVILKPVATEKDLGLSGNKNVSHFSFAEIKRKLKHAMGKERSATSTDDRSCEKPSLDSGKKRIGEEKNVEKISPSRKFLHTEKFPSSLKNRDKAEKMKENQTRKFLNIYIEAKEHLSEMLRHGNEDENSSNGHVLKTVGKILSFPEYNFSPIFSPHRELDHGFGTAQIRFSSKSGPLMQDPETLCFHSDGINEDKVETRTLNLDNEYKFMNDNNVEEAQSSHRENMNNEDETDIIRAIEIEEESNVLDSEQSRSSMSKDEQSGFISEECDPQGYSECATAEGLFLKESFQESQAESSQSVTPSSPPTISKVDHVVTEIDKTGRPSPISVLEPLFAGDDIDISPTTTVSPPVELPIMPRRLQFEKNDSSGISQDFRSKTCANDLELIFEYCANVLHSSGIMWGDLSIKLLSSNQLLDPSLFVEGVLFPNHLCHDQKLLFDCMNEVLTEICEYYFGCSPFVWFVDPTIRPIPKSENTIHEVCKGVKWHLTPHLSPQTLEQIVKKDLVKNGNWMDLRIDSDIVGKEMSEVVFGELMEETILSCLEENEGM